MEITSASTPSATPAQPGRPTLRTDAAREHLCSLIRHGGLSDNAAATAAGIHRTTLWRWKQVDGDLELTLAQSREQFREIQLNKILTGAKNWRAAAWLLEHIFPADYHPKAQERQRFQDAQSSSSTSSCSETVEISQTPRCKTPEIPTPSDPRLPNPEPTASAKDVEQPPHSFTPSPSHPVISSDPRLQNQVPPVEPASSSSPCPEPGEITQNPRPKIPEDPVTLQNPCCKTP